MNKFRNLMSVVVLALLLLGYGASQVMFFRRETAEYAKKVDCPPVQWLALFLLLVCISFAFIKDEEADGK